MSGPHAFAALGVRHHIVTEGGRTTVIDSRTGEPVAVVTREQNPAHALAASRIAIELTTAARAADPKD